MVFTCYTIIMLCIVFDGSFPADQFPGFLVQAVHIIPGRVPCDGVVLDWPVRLVAGLPLVGFTACYTKHIGNALTDVSDSVCPVYETQPPRAARISYLRAVHRGWRELQQCPIRCHH